VLARNANVLMITIWIQSSIALAAERNENRNLLPVEDQKNNAYVSKVSFDRIVNSFQPPDPRFIFDRNLLVIENSQHDRYSNEY